MEEALSLALGFNLKGMDQVGKYGSNTEVAIGKVPYRDFMHFSGGKFLLLISGGGILDSRLDILSNKQRAAPFFLKHFSSSHIFHSFYGT